MAFLKSFKKFFHVYYVFKIPPTFLHQCINTRGFGFGVEVSELLDVQLSVAVFVELPQQYADPAGREAIRRILQNARRFVQSDVAVPVVIVLLELRHQLHLPAFQP